MPHSYPELQLSARPVLREEVEHFYQLDRLCFSPEFRFSRETMWRFVLQPNAVTVRAEEQGQLLGFVLAHQEPAGFYVVTLDVHPAARRRGVASQLLRTLQVRAEQVNISAIFLHVWTENVGALAFYRDEGFTQIAREVDFYGPGRHALVLARSISADLREAPAPG